MLNWTCAACDAFNSPRRDICWNCGYSRSITTSPTPQDKSQLLQLFRALGIVGAIALIGRLFLPWVVRTAPDGDISQFAGHVSIFGKIIIGFGLLIFLILARKRLAFGWYILIILLALVPLLFSSVPAEIIQVEDMIAANIAGIETVAQTVPGTGVTVANWAAITIMISTFAQLFLPKKAKMASGEITLQQG